MRFLLAVAVVTTLVLVACGSGSRIGDQVSRYDLQKGDCYDSNNAPTGAIPLVECSLADRRVLAIVEVEMESSGFPGEDALGTEATRLCREATSDDPGGAFWPSASTWALDDRTIVCLKYQDAGASDDSPRDEPSGDENSDPPSDGDTSGPPTRRVVVEDILKDDCIDPVDSDGYVLVKPCSEARMRALMIIQMPNSPWPGSQELERAANDFCIDESDWNYRPSEVDWIFGARHIVCLEILRN